MIDLSNYTGPSPTDFATSVMQALSAEGFDVVTTPQGRFEDSRATLRILWRGVVVGLMSADLWEKKGYACLYKFPDDRSSLSISKAPKDFDVVSFATQLRCEPNRLYLDPRSDGSYLYVEDEATCLVLMLDWARRIDEILFPSRGNGEAQQILNDVRAILEDKTKSPTQRRVEADARLGQGKFRADLMKEFGSACAATQLGVAQVLRASHILPWKKSDDDQKVDPKNGLLPSANLDALFDRYMITFRPDGRLEFSASITQAEQERLGPAPDLQRRPCDKRAAYLKLHNAEFDQLEKKRLKYMQAWERS
ncbi:HNH endonuclease signature motif containing protein [Burkholderia sp. Ac-20365]|uniref:HNH endonuclease n=1 Tax=Burkholderia sp. Ac-20365 TaxID=2703897 RepID=UPI00197B9926|nr:HNH endonuclease signature motif containing protein [Burkholderia sp. Ac-20365]MBN3760999.1 HNH endonuclease [Burkholderia sp. Ac-20365]